MCLLTGLRGAFGFNLGKNMSRWSYHRTSTDALVSLLSISLMAGIGCSPAEEPVFDEILGIQAVSVAEGALTGTFGLYTRGVGYVSSGAFGEVLTANDDFLLVERTWNAETAVYEQQTKLCGAYFFPVLDAQTVRVPDETFDLVPLSSTETLEVQHEQGTYRLSGHLQLLALRDLPDPFDTPFPPNAEAALNPPHSERIYDMDQDGNPGVTLLTEGVISGEIYAIQRKRTDLEGVVASPDLMMGISDHLYEAMTLGASHPFLENPEPQQNGTDPAESWFEEKRLPPGSNCATVLEMVDNEELGPIRPF